jgi:hypothetical protein
MSAGYILSVVHRVLHENWGVAWSVLPIGDGEALMHQYRLGKMGHTVALGAEIDAIDGLALRVLCRDLGLDFDTVRRKVDDAGGLWRAGGPEHA